MYSGPYSQDSSSNATTYVACSGKPVKQGWVYKKSGSFIRGWCPKYLVLYPASASQGACLMVYDQCDQSKNPRYNIPLDSAVLEVKNEYKIVFKFPVFKKKLFSLFIVKKGSKEFILASNTRLERDEWCLVINAWMNPGHQLAKQGTLVEMMGESHLLPDSPSKMTFVGKASRQRMRTDDDAVSTYSAVTFGESVRDSEDSMSIGSRLETLSFCSEPVLSTEELDAMGREDTDAYVNDLNRKETGLKRKQAVEDEKNTDYDWNGRYQALISQKADSDDAGLHKDVQLLELIGEFKEAASDFAKDVIDTYHLKKRFKDEIDAGDRFPFGSRKYIPKIYHRGIIFQFACDYHEASFEEVSSAVNRFSHELKSIDILTRAISTTPEVYIKIYTTLFALVDYKGFRIVAYADSNLKDEYIILDYLAEYPKTHDELNDSLIKYGKQLNLKNHTVQLNRGRRVPITFSIETEAFMANNSFFLSNLSSLLPLDSSYHGILATDSSPSKSITPAQYEALAEANYLTNPSKRLRPEYVASFGQALASNGLTAHSAATKSAKLENDIELLKAARYLRENWIPAFVKQLDELETRPIDSPTMTVEMHRNGVNMRYLGIIAKLSNLPHIRNLACIEMIGRAFKHIFNAKLRSAIIHFKSVGATLIDEEMKNYAVLSFSLMLSKGEKNLRYFDEKIKDMIYEKFNYAMDYNCFFNLHKPALFKALQYHCGVLFEDSTDYSFGSLNPISKQKFIRFESKVKTLSGIPRIIQVESTKSRSKYRNISEDEQMAYQLARYFKSRGPKSKLNKSDSSAYALNKIAAYYCEKARYEEAKMYAQAALSTCSRNSCLVGIAKAICFHSTAAMQPNIALGPGSDILSLYQSAINSMQWHCGSGHPLIMAVHDRLASLYIKAKNFEHALEVHDTSLEIAEVTLGKNHSTTAGYLTKAGCLLLILRRIDEAIDRLNEALHIYDGLNADASYTSEVHYHFAECLEERGDLSGALSHSQICKRLRENAFGLMDPRSVDSFRQTARILLAPYRDYHGVLTPQIKKAYAEAIFCLEKVFRYLKTVKESRKERRANRGMRRSDSMVTLDGTQSLRLPLDTYLVSQVNIAGPLVRSPFGPSPPIPRTLLHQLTRRIIGLKLALVDNPKHRDIIRTLRTKLMNERESLDSDDAKAVILRLAAVSPSVYLDGLLQRLDDNDECAIDELKISLMLTEQDTVGLSR